MLRLCFILISMSDNHSAYLYYTDLRFYAIIIDWYFGLFYHPFLDCVCDVWHHWGKRKIIDS